MNASGTARPISPAGATPFRAIAAVGAMIPIDSAMASQKRSSRRSPVPGAAGAGAAPTVSLVLIEPLAPRRFDSREPTPRYGAALIINRSPASYDRNPRR